MRFVNAFASQPKTEREREREGERIQWQTIFDVLMLENKT